MGLAASQGRYLCLTARMSDLVYEGQQISSQRLILATETQEAAQKYNDAMSDTVMEAQVADKDGNPKSVRLTYSIITNPKDLSDSTSLTGLGMRIVDASGHIVVPKNAPEELKNSLKNSNSEVEETFVYDEGCDDPEYIQNMILSGEWFLEDRTDENSEWKKLESWQGSSQISERNYTENDAAAEAEYEEAMQTLQKKDKMLELRLEQIQTEENSVETEIDSVKQVISDNIDNSFKTFA